MDVYRCGFFICAQEVFALVACTVASFYCLSPREVFAVIPTITFLPTSVLLCLGLHRRNIRGFTIYMGFKSLTVAVGLVGIFLLLAGVLDADKLETLAKGIRKMLRQTERLVDFRSNEPNFTVPHPGAPNDDKSHFVTTFIIGCGTLMMVNIYMLTLAWHCFRKLHGAATNSHAIANGFRVSPMGEHRDNRYGITSTRSSADPIFVTPETRATNVGEIGDQQTCSETLPPSYADASSALDTVRSIDEFSESDPPPSYEAALKISKLSVIN